jgi:hypothetical protein
MMKSTRDHLSMDDDSIFESQHNPAHSIHRRLAVDYSFHAHANRETILNEKNKSIFEFNEKNV